VTGIAWLPFGENLSAASTRLRCHDIVLQLGRMGHDARVVTAREEPGAGILVLSKRYDVQAHQLARRVRDAGGSVVLDLCDNHFDQAPDDARSGARRRRLTSILDAIDHLVVSTDALAAIVRRHTGYSGAMTVIGDPVDDPALDRVRRGWRQALASLRLEGLQRRRLRDRSGAIRLIWFGAHGVSYADGGMLDLLAIADLLRRIPRLELTVLSNSWRKYWRHIRRLGVPTRYFEWNPRTFAPLLRAHDICVIPIRVNPFTICKSNNRAATALWHGLPVVANAIPSYVELQPFTMLDNWDAGLHTYIDHPEIAAEHVRQGRGYLKEHYSLDAITRRWLDVFAAVSERRRS
jgi:hypothetical protein